MFSYLREITLASVLVMPINGWILERVFLSNPNALISFFQSSEDEINDILVDATEVISFLSNDYIT